MGNLTPRERDVQYLRLYLGLDIQDCADLLGIAAGTAENYVKSLRRKLSADIKPSDYFYDTSLPSQFRAGYPIRVNGLATIYKMNSQSLHFEADRPLQAGMPIRIRAEWPAKIEDSASLYLILWGITTKAIDLQTEMRIGGHEFKTRGKLNHA